MKNNKLAMLTTREQKYYNLHSASMVIWEMMQTEFPRLQKYEGIKPTHTLDTHKVDTLILHKKVEADLTESWEIELNKELIGNNYKSIDAALNAYEYFKENISTGKVGRIKVKQDEICTVIKK